MNQWYFVLGAYAVVIATTFALIVASWVAMRRAEAAAEALRRR